MINSLIFARKRGEPISVIFKISEGKNPHLDEMIILTSILRQCYENNCPFTFEEISKLFNIVYCREFHSSKEGCIKSLLKFLIPTKMNLSVQGSSKKLGDSGNDFSQDKSEYLKDKSNLNKTTNSQLNFAHSEGGRNE